MTTRINRYLESVSAFDNLELDLIRSSCRPLRTSTGDISGLVESIRQHGLLQPILVRPTGGKFEVIAGNRRLEACRRLKHRKVKAVIIELDDKAAYEVAITENVQRKTLDPLEEGLAFKRYCSEFGWGSQTELSRRIGKSQEYVSHRIKLLSLPEEVKTALVEKRISLASAEEVMWMKEDEAKKKMVSLISTEKLSMHDVRHIVKSMNSLSGSPLHPRGFDDEITPPPEEEIAEAFPVSTYRSKEYERESEFSKIVAESILILRIALIRMDDLATRGNDPPLKQLLISKRIQLHSIIDDLISVRKQGMPLVQELVNSNKSQKTR